MGNGRRFGRWLIFPAAVVLAVVITGAGGGLFSANPASSPLPTALTLSQYHARRSGE